MNIKLLILMIILFMGMCGCTPWQDDEQLSLPKMLYTGNELRTDGYYYCTGETTIIAVFFYKDGTMIRAGSIPIQEIPNREEMFKNGEFYNHIKNNKTCWSIYLIEDEKITTNYWVSPRPFQCYFEEGTILNDTTFVLQRYYRMEDGEMTDEGNVNETFHFRQFSPKPDSTNMFIP